MNKQIDKVTTLKYFLRVFDRNMSIHWLKLTCYPTVHSVKYSAIRPCTNLREYTADTFDILATLMLYSEQINDKETSIAKMMMIMMCDT